MCDPCAPVALLYSWLYGREVTTIAMVLDCYHWRYLWSKYSLWVGPSPALLTRECLPMFFCIGAICGPTGLLWFWLYWRNQQDSYQLCWRQSIGALAIRSGYADISSWPFRVCFLFCISIEVINTRMC